MTTTLYEISAKLRQLKSVGPEIARRAAPAIKQQIARNVAAQQDTNHKPWPKRSPKVKNKSGPMLTGAAAAVDVVVSGSSIILSLPFEPYGRHNVGAVNQSGRGDRKVKTKRSRKKDPKKRLIAREIIPNNPEFLPPTFAKIIKQELDQEIAKQLGEMPQ